MTPFAIFKVLCGLIAIVTGTVWIKRRMVPVTSEESTQVLYNMTGWDAVMIGIAVSSFGLALLLDAFGIFEWVGEW